MNQQSNPRSAAGDISDPFKELAAFEVSPIEETAAASPLVEQELAGSASIRLDVRNATPGMRAAAAQALGERYRHWQWLNARMRDGLGALAPRLAQLRAIDEDIAQAKEKIASAEPSVLQMWRHAQRYIDAKTDFEAADRSYQTLYEREGRREPRLLPKLVYVFAIAIIGAVEWLINYEAFLGGFGVPVIATGFTAAVAFTVAAASHEHGLAFKQGEQRYHGDHVTARQMVIGLVWLGFITIALIGAFIFVGWNRYFWALDVISKLSAGGGMILGGEPVKIDVVQKVVVSVIGNVLVWMFGVAVSYWVHDPNPAFADALTRRRKAQKTFTKYKRRIDDQIRALVAQQQKEIAALELQRAAEEQRDPLAAQVDRMQTELRDINSRIARDFQAALADVMDRYRFGLFEDKRSRALRFYKDGSVLGMEEYLKLPLVPSLPEILSASGREP